MSAKLPIIKPSDLIQRSLPPPSRSFFLFGPRGVGKSTWVNHRFEDAYKINLLQTDLNLEFAKNPSRLRELVLTLPKDRWVLIDEIQKVPDLLDEVHFLMSEYHYNHFILSGSSARKLKKVGVNLLAGRASTRKLFPLTSQEVDFSIDPYQTIQYGNLPLSVLASSNTEREDFLTSYVTTYLNEEIKLEGLTRNIGAFTRFLEVAALMAGQKVNMSSLARDAKVGRDAVEGYFGILEDTLIGSWLPSYKPRAKVKEIETPKFYWFDCGVLNSAAGAFKQPPPADWKGVLLEHWIFHEINAYLVYSNSKGSLGYWGTPHNEIDFVWWYGEQRVAIEVKASKDFRNEFLKGIRSFSEAKKLDSSWVVYLGEKELNVEGTHVVPVTDFLKKLHSGKVMGKHD